MKFISTNNLCAPVSLRDAVLSGMPADGGLFMPESIPMLPKTFLADLESFSFQEIAQSISTAFLAEDIPGQELQNIVKTSMDLDLNIHRLDDQTSVLETFHGPTMAFKDFGARFMARLMSYLIRGNNNRELTILVATSGDTGSAVANGFLAIPGMRVIILYPSGMVSPSQEQQLTTQGANIQALEVAGTFDDCQKLVKMAFADTELRVAHQLSSANSINIARLLPQTFYYAYAAGQLMSKKGDLVVSVPSGNFGNLTAGLLARRMGIHIKHFIAATNRNDMFPKYLTEGINKPQSSVQTLSNAMDVGNPSNLARIQHLFGDDIRSMRKEISSWSFSDIQTLEMIGETYEKFKYIIDPHTAVGLLGLCEYEKSDASRKHGLVISTAHAAKFAECVEPVIGQKIPIPSQLALYLDREKQAISMSKDYLDFREYLMDVLG